MFDVVIHLKVSYCVKAYQKIDIDKGTFLPHYRSKCLNEKDNHFPVVDFDPVNIYVNDLRAAYGDLAHFYSDVYGDTKIYVLWKPEALKQKDLKNLKNIKYSLIDPINNKLELNLTAILDDFKIIGNQLVEDVIVKRESLIFK